MKNPNKNLWLDISACLILKAILLTTLWWVCFSHPNPNPEATATQHLTQLFSR